MENIFFNTVYTTLQQMLIDVSVFLLVSLSILYVLYFILAKLLFQKNKQRKEINLRLAFLWSVFVCFMLFNIYIFVLYYKIGIDSMHWTKPMFYFGIIAPLTIYFGLIVLFFIKRQSLVKIINDKSIN